MEIFDEGLTNKTKFQDENGHYTECYDWEASEVTDGVITEFVIEDRIDPLEGSVNIRFLPPSVTLLHLVHQNLGGTLDTAEIHSNLISLKLWENVLDGSFVTGRLPQSIVSLDIGGNIFSGSRLGCSPTGDEDVCCLQK